MVLLKASLKVVEGEELCIKNVLRARQNHDMQSKVSKETKL